MAVIDNLALSKNKRIKGTSKDWFDAEIMEKINERDKVFKKFKKSRLHVDKDNYNEARNELQKHSISNVNCLENDESAIFDFKEIDNLPNPSNKYGVLPVAQYYSHLGLTKKFDLLPTKKRILRDIDTSKAAGINRFPGRFLEDGTNVLAKPVTDINRDLRTTGFYLQFSRF